MLAEVKQWVHELKLKLIKSKIRCCDMDNSIKESITNIKRTYIDIRTRSIEKPRIL